jgi:glycine/serine hydroxymethyltransferase
VVELIDKVLQNKDNPKELAKIKKKVNTMMEKFPLFNS